MGNYVEYDTTGKPHPYHLVNPSIIPFLGALAGGLLATGMIMYMHDVKIAGVEVGLKGVIAGLLAVLIVMFFWWKSCIHEGMVEKAHSAIAKIGFRYGMALFISSEVMFFVAFFWAFFDAALFSDQETLYARFAHTGGHWPPNNGADVQMQPVPAMELPFMMTMILLLSGCTVTWAHHAILEGRGKDFSKALGLTALLGVMFLCFQIYEYAHAHFGFTQGIYPSTFFMATGFHGFHVLVGTIFLTVCYLRSLRGDYTQDNHFSFEAAAWYWHFVDVVWLFLFIAVYFWGGMNALPVHH